MADAPRIDWDAVIEEATRLLSDFIRIDTSNPPGREKAACDWRVKRENKKVVRPALPISFKKRRLLISRT